jgi:quinolinate synthase
MVVEIREFLATYPGQTPADERAALAAEVRALRVARRAVILAHNYQLPEIQDVADFVGDSLELSRQAAATDAEVIVFCGVHFMAQTAKLLSPERVVVLPDPEAGCPMADMITPAQLARFKAQYPGRPVVAYVNTTAEVKADCDICCTSANSVKIVNSLPEDELLFVPDQYLARWTEAQTSKRLIAYPGFCPTHVALTAALVEEARAQHPEAVVMCHPECLPEVSARADVVASTSGMVRAAREGPEQQFIVATEWGLAYRLARENPQKYFWVFPEAVCPNMKKISLAKLAAALRVLEPRIEIPAAVLWRARETVERMLAVV